MNRLAPELIKFSQELVRARSVTGEEQVAQELVKDKLESLGASVDYWKPSRSDFKGYEAFVAQEKGFESRPNLVARFNGSSPGMDLAFNGHIDVVSEGDRASWKYPPYAGRISGGRLYGRGACDMKPGLAATIFAVQALMEANFSLQRGILVESVIGEESGGVGTLSTILRGYSPRASIIAEPTNLELTIAQAGCLMFRLTIRGKAAHGALRHLGISAVEKFMPVLTGLQRLEDKRRTMRDMPLYAGIPNPVPLSVGTLRAGNWDSTVPEKLVAEGRYGVWPGESLNSAKTMFEDQVGSVASKDDWLSRHPPKIVWFGPQWESAEIKSSHWLTKMMQRAFHEAIGGGPRLSGTTGGTDMRLFTGVAGVPAIIFGPGEDSLAHSSDEYVAVKDVISACKAYAMAASIWNE